MSFVSIPLSTADIATSLADGSVERYVYFPDSFLVLAVLDGTNAVKEVYTRGPDLSGSLDGVGGIGGLLAVMDSSSVVRYYHADIMGNVVALTDASGSVVSTFRYTPFGQFSARTGSVLPRYLFSSKEFDRTANLYYYGYRYYFPRLGRWITRDPIGEKNVASLYSYVGNHVFNGLDALGLCEYTMRLAHGFSTPDSNWRHLCGDENNATYHYVGCGMNGFNKVQQNKYPDTYVPIDNNPPEGDGAERGLDNAYDRGDEEDVQEIKGMGWPFDEVDIYYGGQIDAITENAVKSLIKQACECPICCKTVTIHYECGKDYGENPFPYDKCGTSETYNCKGEKLIPW